MRLTHHSMSEASLMSYSVVGQKIQWQEHHRKLCKKYNSFVASPEYQALSPTDRVDAILLSQFLAATFPHDDFTLPTAGMTGPLSIFFDLIKGPESTRRPLPVCRPSRSTQIPAKVVEEVYSRFGNNNFLVHSHLTSCAHGVFPLASRLFNHSCVPNCVARYTFTQGVPVRMVIVAIQNIAPGDEVRA